MAGRVLVHRRAELRPAAVDVLPRNDGVEDQEIHRRTFVFEFEEARLEL